MHKLTLSENLLWFTLQKCLLHQHYTTYILGEVLLSPNEYNHTFSCMLPVALPTSVEGNIGYIRYSVAVHIEKPLWSDRRVQENFTVIKALNLNDDMVLRVCVLLMILNLGKCELFMNLFLAESSGKTRTKELYPLLDMLLFIWSTSYKWMYTGWRICTRTNHWTFVTN